MAVLDIVQSGANDSDAPATSLTLTGVTTGNALLIMGMAYSIGAPNASCADDKGNSYTMLSDGWLPMFYANNVTGGTVVITLTESDASDWISFAAFEIEAGGLTLTFGATGSFYVSSGSWASPSLTTTYSNEQLVGAVHERGSNPANMSFVSGWTGQQNVLPPGGSRYASVYANKRAGSPGSYNASGGDSGNGNPSWTELVNVAAPSTDAGISSFRTRDTGQRANLRRRSTAGWRKSASEMLYTRDQSIWTPERKAA